jgi:hypothetical protein
MNELRDKIIAILMASDGKETMGTIADQILLALKVQEAKIPKAKKQKRVPKQKKERRKKKK